MICKLKVLKAELERKGLEIESLSVDRLIKLSSIPGLDSPADEIDIEGVSNAISHLKENPGLTLYLDSPLGALKWTINGKKEPMPFHYGEVIEANNPSDDAGWDVVIAPEASDTSSESDGVHYIPAGHNLMPVGYVPVNPDKNIWQKNTSTEVNPDGKPPPLGNDKIILAPNGSIKKNDMIEIEDFFSKIWNFNNIVWL